MVLHKLQALGRYTGMGEYRSQYTSPLALSPWTKKQSALPLHLQTMAGCCTLLLELSTNLSQCPEKAPSRLGPSALSLFSFACRMGGGLQVRSQGSKL